MSQNKCDNAKTQEDCNHTISRRTLLVGASALGAALATGASMLPVIVTRTTPPRIRTPSMR